MAVRAPAGALARRPRRCSPSASLVLALRAAGPDARSAGRAAPPAVAGHRSSSQRRPVARGRALRGPRRRRDAVLHRPRRRARAAVGAAPAALRRRAPGAAASRAPAGARASSTSCAAATRRAGAPACPPTPACATAASIPGVDVRHDVTRGRRPGRGSGAPTPWRRAPTRRGSAGTTRAPARPSTARTGALRSPRTPAARRSRTAAPVAWQLLDGRRAPVAAAYRVERGRVRRLRARPPRPRAIRCSSPRRRRHAGGGRAAPSLAYTRSSAASNWDELYDVDVSPAGDAYVTGFTISPNFPVAAAQQGQFADVLDAVVARVSAAGSARLQHLPRRRRDGRGPQHRRRQGRQRLRHRAARSRRTSRSRRRCSDRSTAAAARSSPCHDAFVTKLDPAGRIVFSTYLGGTGNEEGWGIARRRRRSRRSDGQHRLRRLPDPQRGPGRQPQQGLRGRRSVPVRHLRRAL